MSGIVVATFLAFGLSLFGTPLLIKTLRQRGYAQAIRTDTDDVQYPEHSGKKGTPSMGGIMIVLGSVVGYLVAKLFQVVAFSGASGPTASGLLVLLLMTGLAAVGFADDYIKIFKQRATGVRARTKLLGQAAVAIVFAVLVVRFPDQQGLTAGSQAISFVRDTPIVLPFGLFLAWIYLMVAAASNGVNLADGLDGLASGAAVMVLGAYVVIGVWQYVNACSRQDSPLASCYQVRDPLDLAVVAAAVLGATLGFLWWNASPAQIFMGDTGSLALGGALAGLAVVSRTDLLLPILGGLFVIITMSVILQVASYKLTGRRIFLMAPLQHHFEIKGWGEVTIVTRFWIISAVCVGLGLGLVFAEWLAGGLVS